MQVRVFLFGVLLAQLADAATFTVGMALHGIELEGNGLAVALYNLGGVDSVLIAKGAAIVATLMLLMSTAHRFPRLLVWGSAAATSFGLLGALTNLASLALIAAA